jgi:putative endonuclease
MMTSYYEIIFCDNPLFCDISLADCMQMRVWCSLMEWFVYVLLNDAGIAYTGIAKDVAARLGQHNAGRGARFTRGRGPWRAVHIEGPMEHGNALRREIAIKGDAAFKRALKTVILE